MYSALFLGVPSLAPSLSLPSLAPFLALLSLTIDIQFIFPLTLCVCVFILRKGWVLIKFSSTVIMFTLLLMYTQSSGVSVCVILSKNVGICDRL